MKIDQEKSTKKRYSLFINSYRVMKLVWDYDKKYLPIEAFLTTIKTVLPFVLAWYSALFINKITEGGLTSIYDKEIVYIVFIYLSIPLIISLSEIWYQYFFNKFYIFFSQYIKLLLLEKRHNVDIQTYENSDFNNLTLRVNENEDKIIWFADWMFYIFARIIEFVAIFFILFSYKWWIILLLTASLVPSLILEIKFGDRKWGIWQANSEIKRKFYLINSYFSTLSTLTEIKLFKSKEYFKNIINNVLTIFNSDINNNENKRTKFKNLAMLLEFVVSAFIVFYLMNDVINQLIAIGTFIFFLGRISEIKNSISEFFRGFSRLSADNKFLSDVFIFLDTKKVLKNGNKSIKNNNIEIEFKNISFAYPNTTKNILNNLNFKIKAGEKIAIVGINGAGKTTLTKLMMRFYDVTSGDIIIGDNNIKDLDLSDYYQKIGYLSQEYAKYKLPIKEAIALGNVQRKFDFDKVIESAKKAGAHEFISEWKNGYDTHLGKEFEDGVEPSIGQWQKLALARLFYKDPQIWILDEPTASIDAVAEMSIFNELEKLSIDKTVILISHRFNTVKNADRIMVIDDGEIKEFDTHKNLMKIENGIYNKLFELQKNSYNTK